MTSPRLESLPQEILDMLVATFSTEPADPLSTYYVPAPTTPISTSRVRSYMDGRKDLKDLCQTNKNFLNIARRHLFSHVIITSHDSLYLLFRTMLLVPDLAKRITTLESTICLDDQIGPNYHPVVNANPLIALDYYDGIHNGKSAVDFILERLPEAFLDDRVLNQQALLSWTTPSSVLFLAVLALAKNLKTLTIGYYENYGSNNQPDMMVDGRARLICEASINNRNGQGRAPLQKLGTIRFRRFLGEAMHHAPADVPLWLSFFMKLPQVVSVEIAGLCDAQLDTDPNIPVLTNGLRGILTDPHVNNLTRLELVFDLYSSSPVKSRLSPLLFSMRGTLKHLSVTFLGDTNSYNTLQATGMLNTPLGEEMRHDRIESLPGLHKLEHLEVDLHSLFGWILLWAMDDAQILNQYPERAGSLLVRDTIPLQSLKSLHLLETFADVDVFLNVGAPSSTTGVGYINGPLALHNQDGGPLYNQVDFVLLAAARTKALSHVLRDLLLLVQQGGIPSLRKFVYTPITHARLKVDPRYDDSLLALVPEFAKYGVEMEVVYAGQLGRICQ